MRRFCKDITSQGWFDFLILIFISANCITLAMERPSIPPWSRERYLLGVLNHCFTFVFAVEMCMKSIANGFVIGRNSYFSDNWNRMDGSLVIISLVDASLTAVVGQNSKLFRMLRVFRLVRALRPLRVINRAPGLKLVVLTLLSSLKPIGNIVLICCTFFVIFGILGVQVFICYIFLGGHHLYMKFCGYFTSFWYAKELFYIKALGKVVAGISWKVWEGCMCRRERVNKDFNQQTRKRQF